MVKLALLWHMHQPYYEDLATGEHILPWVRLHATKDYWGMVALTREFPGLNVTFNLVPSLLVQLEAFAEGRARDRHLIIGLKPADLLTVDERRFLVAKGFHAPVDRAIRPYARYADLHARREDPETFSTEDLRDLQVWHKLVWMDPDWLRTDARLLQLMAKGRGFSESDKLQLREVELELLRAVIPAYRTAAATGRAELSSSPFYHPILPLLCDTDTHLRAHPHSALPRQLFACPADAAAQLQCALDYHERMFQSRPRGIWPSEGSVSDQVIDLLQAQGVHWTATDEEILSRSLGRPLNAGDLYRPYRVGQEDRAVRVLFRDHQLSDLIGFAYQSWEADVAADDFVTKVRDAGRRFSLDADGEVPIVTVVLDGENAWEHYAGGGRPFLRALYGRLEQSADIQTITMSEAAASPARSLPSIFPGSWINGDFYIWAGHRDDHRAWSQLAAARTRFVHREESLGPEARVRAREEIFIAEGSDWFWWYGDDHSSDHDREFDDLFRRHVRNVYRALGEAVPDDLYVTNITTDARRGPLSLGALSSPRIDGRAANFTQWAFSVDVPLGGGGGTMHRVASHLVRNLRVASDLERLYVRVEGGDLIRRVRDGQVKVAMFQDRPYVRRVEPVWAAADILTAAIPYSTLGGVPGQRVSLSILVTDPDGHTMEQHPSDGPFEFDVPTSSHDVIHWLV